jgi:hypothetical protein
VTRRAARQDGNQPRLRSRFEGLGGSWLPIPAVTGGEPDALLGWRGKNQLVELKDPGAPPCRRRLRAKQREWHASWRGDPPAVVETLQDILRLFP